MAVYIFLRKKSDKNNPKEAEIRADNVIAGMEPGGRCGSGGRSTGRKDFKNKKEEISTKIAQSISRQGFQPRAFREILLAALTDLAEIYKKTKDSIKIRSWELT